MSVHISITPNITVYVYKCDPECLYRVCGELLAGVEVIFFLQCLDPYSHIVGSTQCSLDRDGDKTPDIEVRMKALILCAMYCSETSLIPHSWECQYYGGLEGLVD